MEVGWNDPWVICYTGGTTGRPKGGRYTEHVIAGTGHTPFVEKPDEFMALLTPHLV